MKLIALALLTTLAGIAAPRVVYSKNFPGSTPPLTIIEIEQDGSAVYKEAVDDQYPIKFKLDAEQVAEVFRLAEKLDKFNRTLESGLKVANMGMKSFRWEDGATRSEAKFNFTQDDDARILYEMFEKMAETEQRFIILERTVKYDKLGVSQALVQFEISWDQKRVIAPEQFLPLLDRVSKNDSYMHMARERAARLADIIRNRKAPKAE